jgi:hypothetical protein
MSVFAAFSLVTLSSGGFGDARPYVQPVQQTNSAALSVAVSNQSGAATFTTTISNLFPDDSNATDNTPTDAWDDRVVQVVNTTNAPTTMSLGVTAGSLSGGADATEQIISDGSNGARIQVWRCRVGVTDTPADYTQAVADNAAVCGAAEQSLLAEADLPLADSALIATLPANTNVNLRIRIRLPEAASNLAQGDSAALTFTVRLTPRTAGAV